MNKVYLHTGSNIGDRMLNLSVAAKQIEEEIGRIRKASPIYRTAAWGIEDQPDFLNQAFEIESPLSAEQILKKTQEIERQMGRVKLIRWGERLIDIDLIFYNDQVIHLPDLIVPHPELQNRNFVLAPMLDIAPDFEHPIIKKTISELYELSDDALEATIYHDLESGKGAYG